MSTSLVRILLLETTIVHPSFIEGLLRPFSRFRAKVDLIGLVLRTPLVLKSDKSKQRTLPAQAMDGSNKNITRSGRKLLKGKVIGGIERQSNIRVFLSE